MYRFSVFINGFNIIVFGCLWGKCIYVCVALYSLMRSKIVKVDERIYKRKRGRPRVYDDMVAEWRRLIAEEGWSQRGVALYFGYGKSTVWRHVNGKYDDNGS